MGKKIEKYESSAVPPWRQPAPQPANKYGNLGMRATNEPGKTPVMYAPRKGQGMEDPKDGLMDQIDPELRLVFSRNFQFLRRAFSVRTILTPLPQEMAENVASNLGFLTRIFTQFIDPKGIENVRSSMGLGEERQSRRVA